MKRAPAFDVAIVGGGASAALLAIQLLRRAPRGFRLVLVDRAGDFARGIAYRTVESCHLLNVPAARMSALPDEEGHFLSWLRRHESGAGPETYARRLLYGDYLSELLDSAERGAAGTLLERTQDEVQDLEEVSSGVRLQLATGDSFLAGRVVLALGNFPPSPLEVAEDAQRLVWQSPWPRNALWPPSEATVLVVGAGLTAVDVLLSLAARGHRGSWHVLSRHGLMPNPHGETTLAPLKLELPRGKVRRLVRAVREASAPFADWRPAVDSVRTQAQALWRSVSHAEQARFMRHARTYWEVHRHRVAPAVGRVVQGFRDSGQLQVHAGRLLGLVALRSRLEASFRPRGAAHQERLVVDLVVNCTGPAGQVANPDALVRALLRRGLARPGPFRLGLATDERGALLDAHSRAGGLLWTLGSVRRGEVWESTAIPDIRVQAAELATHLVRLPAERLPNGSE